jgi:hypothetical protein
MITLYSYPGLFGVADNNAYGVKVYAFLKLAGLPFAHEHLFDASAAPRGQLPYIEDEDETIGDSDTIITHLIRRHGLMIDAGLGETERDVDLLIGRMLDDLYWVMSYSRWQDDAFWPAFREALLSQHPVLTDEALDQARDYNFKRYFFQGIGRFAPAAVYARGLADLKALADLVPRDGWLHGPGPRSIDAAIYGFLANIWFYPIETPLRRYLAARAHLVRHCTAIHAAINPGLRV